MARLLETLRSACVGLGIAVILPLLIFWGVRVFVERPNWPSDFYEITLDDDLANARNKLEKQPDNAELKYQLALVEDQVANSHKESREKYKHLIKNSDGFLFYTNVAVGLAAIIAGGLVPVLSLSFGLILGGTFCVIGGYIMVWSTISPLIRFLSLLAALLLLISMAYLIARRKKIK